MGLKTKIIGWVWAAIIVLIGLFPPQFVAPNQARIRHRFLFEEAEVNNLLPVDATRLLVYWGLVTVVAIAVWLTIPNVWLTLSNKLTQLLKDSVEAGKEEWRKGA